MSQIGTTVGRATVALALGAVLWGCGGGQPGPEDGGAGAKQRLMVDLVNEPATLDPHLQWNPDSYYVYRNIFDNLVTRTADGEVAPQIASSWRTVSDTVWEFKIRDDVRFHDGSALTADDVVFSVERITDPAFASPQLGQFNSIIDAEVIDSTTARLTTDGPYPLLLAQLVKLSIVPKAHVESVSAEAFNEQPIGSGPYRLVEWQRGVRVALEANPDYWRGTPPFPEVEFRPVPDSSTRVADLRTGRADLVVSLNSDQAAELDGEPDAKVLTALTERVAYIRLNPLHGVGKDARVRRAIAHALDRQLLVDGLKGGYARSTNVMASETHFGHVDTLSGYAFDLEKAKALLAEAGVQPGTELVFTTSPVFDQRVIQALQQMLIEVGFDVEISMSDMRTYLQRFQGPAEESGDLSFGRWSCGCQDLDGVLFPLLHSTSIWSKYNVPEMDAELEAARSALDPVVRMKHYEAIHRMVEDQVPLVPLYQVGIIYGGRRQLQWSPTAGEAMFMMDMQWVN